MDRLSDTLVRSKVVRSEAGEQEVDTMKLVAEQGVAAVAVVEVAGGKVLETEEEGFVEKEGRFEEVDFHDEGEGQSDVEMEAAILTELEEAGSVKEEVPKRSGSAREQRDSKVEQIVAEEQNLEQLVVSEVVSPEGTDLGGLHGSEEEAVDG